MSTTINFSYNGKDYTLEYTKATIKQMEQNGFKVNDIETSPMTTIDGLFAGSFLAHHKFEKPSVINAIYDEINDKQGLINTLSEMYKEQFDNLFDEKETKQGNLNWVKN